MIKTDGNLNISAESRLIWTGKFFEFFNFFKSFHTEVAQNDPQWQILSKSGLDWLKMANFGHFAGFSIFCPKIRLRLTWNGQFHLIHNFSHPFTTKVSHFWRNLKNFCSWGGTSAIFWSFSTFSNHFTPKQLKMTHNGQFCHQSGLDELEMGNFG